MTKNIARFSVPTQPCHPVSWDCTSLGLELLFLVCFLSGAVFEEYSNLRNKDAEAVCDLSMYNYLEVNDLCFQPCPRGFLHFLRRILKTLGTRQERNGAVSWWFGQYTRGRGGVLLGILGKGVQTCSSNPDPLSDQKI